MVADGDSTHGFIERCLKWHECEPLWAANTPQMASLLEKQQVWMFTAKQTLSRENSSRHSVLIKRTKNCTGAGCHLSNQVNALCNFKLAWDLNTLNSYCWKNATNSMNNWCHENIKDYELKATSKLICFFIIKLNFSRVTHQKRPFT